MKLWRIWIVNVITYITEVGSSDFSQDKLRTIHYVGVLAEVFYGTLLIDSLHYEPDEQIVRHVVWKPTGKPIVSCAD